MNDLAVNDLAVNDLDGFERICGTVAVVGSMNADYTVTTERLPGPGETVNGGPLRILPGGKSGNQAAAAARIGATVRLLGAVGSDDNADFLLDALRQAGVDTARIRHAPGPSGTTVITVDRSGENTIVYSSGANARVDVDYIDAERETLVGSDVLGLCLESPMATVTEAARICHAAGVKTLLNNSPFIAEIPHDLAAACDILLVNEHEMAGMLAITEPDDDDWDDFDWHMALAGFRRLGFGQSIVTLGARGSVVLDAEGDEPIARIAAVHVDAVDTTGCGDAFMGTVLAGLASGLSLREAARLASYVSAYAATGMGAQASYGTAEQISERFASFGLRR